MTTVHSTKGLGRRRHYAPCSLQGAFNFVLCLLIASLAGCVHKPRSYKEAMLGKDQIWIAEGVLDSYKERALDLFAYPEGIDLVGYVRSLKPDTNHPVTFGFTEDGGGRVIVRVPARLTNGTPVVVESQYDYGSSTGLSRLSFTIQKER